MDQHNNSTKSHVQHFCNKLKNVINFPSVVLLKFQPCLGILSLFLCCFLLRRIRHVIKELMGMQLNGMGSKVREVPLGLLWTRLRPGILLALMGIIIKLEIWLKDFVRAVSNFNNGTVLIQFIFQIVQLSIYVWQHRNFRKQIEGD